VAAGKKKVVTHFDSSLFTGLAAQSGFLMGSTRANPTFLLSFHPAGGDKEDEMGYFVFVCL
jgi:hypothetical protein